MNGCNRIVLIGTLFMGMIFSCTTTREEITDFVSYYDDGNHTKKVEGKFYNGRERGPWVFYSMDGKEIKKGNYSNGLQDGPWVYNFPFFDGTLFWVPLTLDSFELSLPGTFVLRQNITENYSKVFRDTLDNTILAISLIDSCNVNCVQEYYRRNLDEFATHDNEVVSSKSTSVNSRMGMFNIDEYAFRRPDYDNEIKQYMAYIPVKDENLLVITITNQVKFDDYMRFLIGEVFYHIRYNYERVAFPYEDLLKSPKKFK